MFDGVTASIPWVPVTLLPCVRTPYVSSICQVLPDLRTSEREVFLPLFFASVSQVLLVLVASVSFLKD